MSESTIGETFVEEFLAHAGQYYDPVKAHEYYLRTRKLKNRQRIASGEKPLRNRAQRATGIANRTSKNLGPKRAAKVQALENEAKEKLVKLTEELNKWASDLSARSKAQHDAIAKETSARLEALPKLPKMATPQQREARKERIAKIRGEGASKQKALNDSTKEKYEAKRAEVRQQKDKIFADFKTAVTQITTRAENQQPRNSLTTSTTSTTPAQDGPGRRH